MAQRKGVNAATKGVDVLVWCLSNQAMGDDGLGQTWRNGHWPVRAPGWSRPAVMGRSVAGTRSPVNLS